MSLDVTNEYFIFEIYMFVRMHTYNLSNTLLEQQHTHVYNILVYAFFTSRTRLDACTKKKLDTTTSTHKQSMKSGQNISPYNHAHR